jgi:hypothetical protein
MAADPEGITQIRPEVVRRRSGGWLATCPRGATLCVGVTALTEDEARKKFGFTVSRWFEIIRDAEKTGASTTPSAR